MPAPYQFAYESFDAAAPALVAEWQRLADGMPNALPFQLPAWLAAYARDWPREGAALQLVTARREGRLAAVLPLELQTRRVGPLPLRVATPVCNPHMPLADITVDPDEAATLLPALFDWLLGASRLGLARLDLPGIADDAALGRWLAGIGPTPHHRTVVTGDAARIDTRMDYDTLIKGVSSKHRSNLSRSTKRAETLGALRYETHAGDALLSQGWPLLLEIEASGWKGRAGTAIDSDVALQRFYRDAAQGLEATRQASIGVLWFGDRPAAAVLLLLAGRTAYTHKVGYREEWAAMSPGHLLVREVVQRACADPAIDAVSLVLHPPWSDPWRPVLTPVSHHSRFGSGWQGLLLRQLTQLRDRRAAQRTPPADGDVAAPPSAEVAPVREV